MSALGLSLFWGSVLALVWIYLGFSLTVAVGGLLRRRPPRTADVTPRVSIVIAAHNEESGIERKIRNCLDQDYPADRREILVASDGSTDGTEAIVSSFADRGVRLLACPRRGKIAALNDAVAEATGDLLVFTDANTHFVPEALRRLVRSFADPEVGGVCGNQTHRMTGNEDSAGDGESLYWRYDRWLKSRESDSGSIVSADGAIYAIRRELYRAPSSGVVNDDFAISTAIVAQGKRLVFDREALAVEPPSARAQDEFERKVRIVSRGLWSVLAVRELLNPRRFGFYSFVLFNHKILRRMTPFLLLALLAGSLLLVSRAPIYFAALVAQGGFYFLAVLGGLLRRTRGGRGRLLATPFFICLANLAALVGAWQVIRGRRIETWQPRRQDATV